MEESHERESFESLVTRQASCEEIASNGWIRIPKEFENTCKCAYCIDRLKKRYDFAALLGRQPYVSKHREEE